MRRRTLNLAVPVLLAGSLLVGASASASADREDAPPHRPAPTVDLQEDFDPLGPAVHETTLADGSTAHYVDEGSPDWQPVVLMSGAGTTVRAFGLTEFLRSSREELGLRFISVGRNGFGLTEFDEDADTADYSQAVLEVLGELGVEDDFALVAISGGGPYAADLASRASDRVSSLHLAAALPPYGESPSFCAQTKDELAEELTPIIQEPRVWWGFPEDSAVRQIPGFVETAAEEGGRSFFVRGQMADPAPLAHEYHLWCERPGPDLSALTAPAYLYAGERDTVVPPSTLELWQDEIPNVAEVRSYEDSGHEVQYRHWDQILADVAGYGDHTVLCWQGKSRLVPQEQADTLRDRGATTGVCGWAASGGG
jgi:non-heme chloroperoxidase